MKHLIARRIDELFERCPSLCGFTVRTDDLALCDLSAFPADFPNVIDEVSATLLNLVDEQPEAAELLYGRTFARALH